MSVVSKLAHVSTDAVRRAVRSLLLRITPYASRVGEMILRHNWMRAAFDWTYERSGRRSARVITRLFSELEIRSPFSWTCRFAGSRFQLPVSPSEPRSWSNALFWRWPPALPLRAVYESYLSEREQSQSAAGNGPPLLLDVGANDGMHTLPFAAHGWRCVSFEPQPHCLRYLREACLLNGFSGVETVQGVVTERPTAAADFFVSESSWFSSLTRNQVEKFEPATRIQVEAVTLDGHCENHALSPRCVKVDTEGAEARVLRGGSQTLAACRPDLFVEVLSDEEIKAEIWGILTPLGYKVYLVTEDPQRPLTRLDEWRQFLGAGSQHDHVDIVAMAESALLTRLEERFLS